MYNIRLNWDVIFYIRKWFFEEFNWIVFLLVKYNYILFEFFRLMCKVYMCLNLYIYSFFISI